MWERLEEAIQTCHRTKRRPKENLLPNNNDDENLANKFANFVINKIKRIICEFENYTTFNHNKGIIHNYIIFPLSEDKVKSVICGMARKSCELDLVTTKY